MTNPARAIFDATTDGGFNRLWITDGTPSGTMLFDPTLGLYQPARFTPVGSLVLFQGGSNNGANLFVTDGTTAGTRPVPGPIVDGELTIAFGGTSAVFDGQANGGQVQVWRSDGAAGGTVALTNDAAGVNGSHFTAIDGLVVFRVDRGAQSSLWVSDGTQTGTHALAVDGAAADFAPTDFAVLGGRAIFTATDASGRKALWVTDGTPAGTRELHPSGAPDGLVAASQAVPGGSFHEAPVTVGDRVFFWGETPDGTKSLWVTDGSDAGTVALPAAQATGITAFGNDAVFDNGTALWISDGTPAGTRAVSLPGVDPRLAPSGLLALGRSLLFGVGTQLWSTDGVSTTLLEDGGTPYGGGTYFTPALRLGDIALITPVYSYGDQFGSVYAPNLAATNGTPGALDYLSSNFSFTVSDLTLFGGTVFGPVAGRGTLIGTAHSDVITAYGAFNTVLGNGGQDQIVGGGGGYTRVIIGSVGDGQTALVEDITLFGRGNTVTGGDETFRIVGGTGFGTATLGRGDNDVRLRGAYNTITVGTGTNRIDAGGGNATVLVRGTDTPGVHANTVALSGAHDTVTVRATTAGAAAPGTLAVTGGTGSGVFDAGGFALTLATGGLYNRVTVGAGGGTVAPGSGYDTVDLVATAGSTPAPVSVQLAGSHNRVSGQAHDLNVTGGSGSNTLALAAVPVEFATTDRVAVDLDGNYNDLTLADTVANTVVAGSGWDRVAIVDPIGSPAGGPAPSFVASSVTFAGLGNALTAGDSPVSVRGGDGYATFTLGDGDDAVATAGAHNRIVLGGGHSTVDPGGDSATIVLDGSDAALTLLGAGDKVYLDAGASGSIGGGSAPDLHVYVAPGIGAETIAGILSDPRAVIDLLGGAGGYATAAQAYAALAPDGHGGSRLAIGTGSLDLIAAPPSSLHPSLFSIG